MLGSSSRFGTSERSGMSGGPHPPASGGCLGQARGRSPGGGSGSFPPLALVTLTLFGILPAPGHRSALSPGAAWTAQLPQRGPATSPNGRNSSRARDNKTPQLFI